MKNKNTSFLKMGRTLMILVFIGGFLASCSKDKDEGVNRADFERNYFNIQESDFQGRSLPGSNSSSLQINEVLGNGTVLAGGSNIIRISASEGAQEVIVGVKDRDGFFTVPLVQGRNAEGRGVMTGSMDANLRMLIGQQASENFTIAFSVSDGQGNYSTYQYLTVNLMQAGTGLLQVSLSWDQLNDVDLHVIEPNGERIYFGNDSSANGGQLDVDSNAACSIDGINNENIYYEDSPEVTIEQGEYEVMVDLWSNCSIGPDTNYTIVVYYGGQIIATTEGTNPHNGILVPDDENQNRVSVMKFNISGPPSGKNAAGRALAPAPKAYKLKYDTNNKVFKNFNPKKE